jgi:hypothetical protein
MSGIGRSAAQHCLQRRVPTGDPGCVRVIAARAGGLAAELRRVSGRLTVAAQPAPGSAATSPELVWSGAGQQSFARSIEAKLPQLGLASTRYEAYGTALLDYAAVLDRTQPELAALRRQLADGCAAGGASDPGEDDRLRALARRFDETWQEWDAAGRRCTQALRRASTIDRDQHRNGWTSFTHGLARVLSVTSPIAPLIEHPGLAGLSKALGNLGSELAVAGLVLMAVCPPAAAACFTAAAVVSTAQLVTDSVRAGRHEPGAGIGLLGLDALGALPGGRFAREGEQGVAAVRAAGALRRAGPQAISRLIPGGGLAAHEAAGGHTLARHVGKTVEDLAARFSRPAKASNASSFYDRTIAEDSISALLEANGARIDSWLASSRSTLTLSGIAAHPVGMTLTEGRTEAAHVSGVLVHLRRNPTMTTGYYLHTAYPRP